MFFSSGVSLFFKPSASQRSPRAGRKAACETLELRCLLTALPLAIEPDTISLAAYIAEEQGQEMGPVEPPADENSAPVTDPVDPVAADQCLTEVLPEGEGGVIIEEGEGAI